MDDAKFLKIAIENSKRSFEEGNFPAGAIVVQDNAVIASAISSPFPNLFHADSKAVTQAYEDHGPLKNATLYIGLESCLMCTGVAYWAGIRRIVFAIPKSRVSGTYYETQEDTNTIIDTFNEHIERVHIEECEDEALAIVHAWEKRMNIL